MSSIFDQAENTNIKQENLLEKMDFSISNVTVEENEMCIFFNISIYNIIVHNIRVSKDREFFDIALPHGIHSPYSSPMPVISFYNNDFWMAIRYGIIKAIKDSEWMSVYFKNA